MDCSNGWLDLRRFPCHQLNRSFNALSSDNAERVAFIVFRHTKLDAMRKWTAGGAGGSSRMTLARFLTRKFTDRISTHEWDGTGDHQWRWVFTEPSMASMGIV